MRLLRRTTSSPHHDCGGLIRWSEINLYDICDEVIKKTIPFIDPPFATGDGEPEPRRRSETLTLLSLEHRDFSRGRTRSKARPDKVGEGCRCSWVEFVAKASQMPRFMVSHFWGGRFSDFMAVVDTVVKNKGLSVHTGFWVCTFANCQWGEDFGLRIMDCPFMKAVTASSTTIFIVDRLAGSLGRIWCGLELDCTIRQSKDLELYTPSGRMGGPDGRASSGPLVEAVKTWDIRLGEASDDSYRRQILSYIAGVDETTGLEAVNGILQLSEDRRPILRKDMETVDHFAIRANRKMEYAYECDLFKKNSSAFESLNMTVRCEVMASIGRMKRCHGCEVSDNARRAVTLGQWRTLLRESQKTYKKTWQPSDLEAPAPKEFEDLQLNTLFEHYIMKQIEEKRGTRKCCSYMEVVSDGPQDPDYFVSLSGRMTLQDISAAMDWFAEAQRLSDSTVFWIEILARQCARGAGIVRALSAEDVDEFVRQVEAPLLESTGILSLVDKDQISLQSGFRLLEIELSIRRGMNVYFASATGAIACTCPFESGNWMFGEFDPEIGNVLCSVDAENFVCSNEQDSQMIREAFENAGPEVYVRLSNRLARWGAGCVLRKAAESDDCEDIQRMLTTTGLILNSDTLKGGLGETALHIAAAMGSLRALRVLLEHGADPNVEDNAREKPLHYAAMSGQFKAACMLLSFGAEPAGESSFAETPWQVARQSPAGFLHVSTEKVANLLKVVELLKLHGDFSVSQMMRGAHSDEMLGVVSEASGLSLTQVKSLREVAVKELRYDDASAVPDGCFLMWLLA